MTPSEAHQSAWQRDAGHDLMQIEFWEWLQKTDTQPTERNGTILNHVYHVIEKPFYSKGDVIIGFADVATCRAQMKNVKVSDCHAFEIKPKLYSVGAIIRQCIALESVVARQGFDTYMVSAVVPVDDPLLPLLERANRISLFVWDAGAKACVPVQQP